MDSYTSSASLQRYTKIVCIDVCIIAAAYLCTAMSHLIAFPLYVLDPMRVFLLSSLLLCGSRKNAYAMAVTLPLFSFLVSGHPVFPKNLAIMAELIANVALFSFLSGRMRSAFTAMLASIAASKALYYAIKSVLVFSGALAMNVVDTGLGYQALVAIAVSSLFGIRHQLDKSNK